jgi:hypothetical protein
MRGAIEVGIDTRLSDGIQRTLLRRARRPRQSIAPVPKNQARYEKSRRDSRRLSSKS